MILNVLWALGWAMIVLSALVYCYSSLVTTFGVVMIATHNLLDSVDSSNPLWSILHSPNVIVNHPGRVVRVVYVLIPWVGVTAAGYGLGQIFSYRRRCRKVFLLLLLAAQLDCVAIFVLLRGINVYGDSLRAGARRSRRLLPRFHS